MQHPHLNRPGPSHEVETSGNASRHRRGQETAASGAGIPLYLQRQPMEEEEEELQAKLEIGASNDKYEQQADRVADQVMRMPEPEVQRQPLEEEEEMLQPKPLAEIITPLGR